MMAKLYWRVKKNGKWTWKPVRLGERRPVCETEEEE